MSVNLIRYRRCIRGVYVSLTKVSHWRNLRRQSIDEEILFENVSQKTYKK